MCGQEPSCTYVSGTPDVACDRAQSAYRMSWCNKWAEWRVKRKSFGCHTDWRADCSAGHGHSSGPHHFGNSEWRQHLAGCCLCTNTGAYRHFLHTYFFLFMSCVMLSTIIQTAKLLDDISILHTLHHKPAKKNYWMSISVVCTGWTSPF